MLFGKKKKETVTVTGMSCSHCEQTVEKGVSLIAGVAKVKANAEGNSVAVFYKGDAPDMNAVKAKIVDLGFEVG
jgi:copper chaperone CopZ